MSEMSDKTCEQMLAAKCLPTREQERKRRYRELVLRIVFYFLGVLVGSLLWRV